MNVTETPPEKRLELTSFLAMPRLYLARGKSVSFYRAEKRTKSIRVRRNGGIIVVIQSGSKKDSLTVLPLVQYNNSSGNIRKDGLYHPEHLTLALIFAVSKKVACSFCIISSA